MSAPSPPAARALSPATRRERLFNADFLAQVERLRLVCRHLRNSAARGEHRARNRGSGLEFSDHRSYVEGDDIRHLDWGAYLRLDKLLIRQFEEEGDLSVVVLLDRSGSMAHGGERRFDLALRLAGTIGAIALTSGDRVTMVPFADQPLAKGPWRGAGQRHVLFDFLAAQHAAGLSRPLEAARSFFGQPRRRGLVAVITDCLFADPAALLHYLAQLGHDVALLHLSPPALDLAQLEPELEVVDCEDGTRERLRVTPQVMRDLERLAARERLELGQRCRQLGLGYFPVDADASVHDVMLSALQRGFFLR